MRSLSVSPTPSMARVTPSERPAVEREHAPRDRRDAGRRHQRLQSLPRRLAAVRAPPVFRAEIVGEPRFRIGRVGALVHRTRRDKRDVRRRQGLARDVHNAVDHEVVRAALAQAFSRRHEHKAAAFGCHNHGIDVSFVSDERHRPRVDGFWIDRTRHAQSDPAAHRHVHRSVGRHRSDDICGCAAVGGNGRLEGDAVERIDDDRRRHGATAEVNATRQCDASVSKERRGLTRSRTRQPADRIRPSRLDVPNLQFLHGTIVRRGTARDEHAPVAQERRGMP